MEYMVITYHISAFFCVKFSRGSHLFFMLLLSGAALICAMCDNNDSSSALRHSVVRSWLQHMLGTEDICHVTMLAGYFLDTGGIKT